MLQSIVRNPVKVIVGVLLVVLFGTIGLVTMPTQLTPEVQIPTITIESKWIGASPKEIERQIVQEQEEYLKSVEGVTKMSSECMHSTGRIILEFPVGTDMSEALLKVNTRLQQVRNYPVNADPPVISTANSGDRPIAWFILKPRPASIETIEAFERKHPEFREQLARVKKARNEGLRLRRLRDYAKEHPKLKALLPNEKLDVTLMRKFAEDNIEARFERVDGIANSNVMGGREEEMQVRIDPRLMAAYGVTVQQVRNVLRGQNMDTTAGDVEEGKRAYVVRVRGQYRSAQEIEDTVLRVVENKPVYVRNVAKVVLGYKEPDGMVRQFGASCLAINCQRTIGANVLEVMERLREANRELNDTVLKDQGLYLEQVYDETDYIDSSIGLVENNILVGGFLTIATLLLFLRSGRSTFVIALAIPTSIIGTFLVMSLLGRSLNVISLAGLAFATGMLVDNAVVVLENIYQKFEQGLPSERAAVEGASEVSGAVLSSTLTTLAVFLPVLFVQEEAGQLFRDIALAISAGVGLSLLVSLTLIPMASARLLRERTVCTHETNGQPSDNGVAPRGRFGRLRAWTLAPADAVGGRFVDGLERLNRWLQGGAWRRFAVVTGFVGVALGLSYLLMPKVEYLPSGNRNLVFGIILPPAGYNIATLTKIGERIEARMRPFWDVDPDDPGVDELNYPIIRDFFFVARGR